MSPPRIEAETQPVSLPLMRAWAMPNTERGQGEADEVDVSEDAAAFANLPGGQDGDDYPHWDVEPKTHCQDRDDGPTDERASRDCDPGDRAPSAEGLAAHCGGVASMINASASGTAMPPPMPCRLAPR